MTAQGHHIDILQLEAQARRARAEFIAGCFARLARGIRAAVKPKAMQPA